MRTRSPWPAIIITALMIGGLQQVLYVRAVNALSNPLSKGKNVAAVARVTPQRVPAAGTNCAVTFINTTGEVLCTGYGTATASGSMADGGVTCSGTRSCA